jgi:hypothetical protein
MAKKVTKRTTKKAAKAKSAKPSAGKPAPKKVGALSAAATVLKTSKSPMTCQELIDAMAAKKLWVSPSGKTPANTLHAALMKEINTKGKESRFAKAERGRFEAA